MQVNTQQTISPDDFHARFRAPFLSLQAELMHFVYQDILLYLQEHWDTIPVKSRAYTLGISKKGRFAPQTIDQLRKTEGIAQWLRANIAQKIKNTNLEDRKRLFDSANFVCPDDMMLKRMLGIVEGQKEINKSTLNAVYQTLFDMHFYEYAFCYEVCLSHAWRGDFHVWEAKRMLHLLRTQTQQDDIDYPKTAEELKTYDWLLLETKPENDSPENPEDEPEPEGNATENNAPENSLPENAPNEPDTALSPAQVHAQLLRLQQALQMGRAYMQALDKAFEENVKLIWIQAYEQEQRETQYQRFRRAVWQTPLYVLATIGAIALGYYFLQPVKHRIFTKAELEKSKVTLLHKIVNQHRTIETHSYEYDFSHLAPLDTIWIYGYGMGEDIVPYMTAKKGRKDFIFTKPLVENITFYQKLPNGRNQILYVLPIYVASQKWNGWLFDPSTSKTDHARQPDSLFVQGRMTIPLATVPPELEKAFYVKGGNGRTTFSYVTDFGISADNCTVEFQFSNTPKEGGKSHYGIQDISFGNVIHRYSISILENTASAYYGHFYAGKTALLREDFWLYNQHKTDLLDKTPHHSTYLQTLRSDLRKTNIGGKNDFANYNIHPDSTYTVRIVNNGNLSRTYLNNRLAFETTYIGKIGKLKFISFGFKGIGSIYFVRVRDGAGKEVYFEDFDNPAKPRL